MSTRVLAIGNAYPPHHLGGHEIAWRGVMTLLRAQGHLTRIVTTDYREHIPPFETPLPGLYLANMFQVYPYDRGQNYSIKLANELAKRLILGG